MCAGILRVPLLLLMGVGMVVGFFAEQHEIAREEEEGVGELDIL